MQSDIPENIFTKLLALEDLSSENVWCMIRYSLSYRDSQNSGVKQCRTEIEKKETSVLKLEKHY